MSEIRPLWFTHSKTPADTHVAFRGRFSLSSNRPAELHILGASWYRVWLDGQELTEGPHRFPIAHPEYQVVPLPAISGEHLLAVQIHHEGVSTRILDDVPPFLWARVMSDGKPQPITWRCIELPGYAKATRRINAQLAWVEWCDTRVQPVDWQKPAFDDTAWAAPVEVSPALGELKPASIAELPITKRPLVQIANGLLTEEYGYELDNPSARFFLRKLNASPMVANGLWRRYDLGFISVARPQIELDLPVGAIVEMAMSEALQHDRVCPWITLSASDSCNMDHYVARGGRQLFAPLTPKGGRYLEVHVLCDPEKVKFLSESADIRCYFSKVVGSFKCSDDVLNRIWMQGVHTHMSCSEDALIDNPTRERGQWTGDVVSAGMDIAASAFTDLRLLRRAVLQSAQCADERGYISGLCPGGGGVFSAYAVQWNTAVMHYWALTGENDLLEPMWPHAVRNLQGVEKAMNEQGVVDFGVPFIDWGYVPNPGQADMGLTLHSLASVRDTIRWAEAISRTQEMPWLKKLDQRLSECVARYLESNRVCTVDWRAVGYHRTVLALRLGLVPSQEEAAAVAYIKAHMLSCFPNNPSAPRLGSPTMANPQLITPYFAHYAFPPLLERGEADFVLQQMRACWGWAMETGITTWVEVFDTRWSHCHQWAGCPTWQLSQYGLGLHPCLDQGDRHYRFVLTLGSLDWAEGILPVPHSESGIRISWRRDGKTIVWKAEADQPITVLNTPQGTLTGTSLELRL